MKKLFLTLCFLFVASITWAGTTVSLTWDPNSETDLKGYRIYQDGVLQIPDIICPANDSTCCKWTSEVLTEGEHSWYVTAFDTADNESGPSNTVSTSADYTAPDAPAGINITINLNVSVTQ